MIQLGVDAAITGNGIGHFLRLFCKWNKSIRPNPKLRAIAFVTYVLCMFISIILNYALTTKVMK